MDRNETILANWKPIHEKGIFAYVIPYALRYFIAMASIAAVIFLIHSPNNANTISSVITNNIVLFLIVTLGRVFEWFRKEKQYRDITDLFEMIDKCPACSAKTSPEDKVCPSCGLTLGIEDDKR